MTGIARPFIPWIGSKEKLIPYIWQVFPSNPKLYLEPFGGGGALLLGIQPKISRMDIYNDFNCDLVNLEDMLQNGTVISGTLIEKPLCKGMYRSVGAGAEIPAAPFESRV